MLIYKMSDLADKLFGPLPKEYCALFYYLSVLGFVWLVVALALFISMAVSKRRDASFFISAFLALVGYGVFYLQNRLLHSMCAHSL
jgi:hypothetical protein